MKAERRKIQQFLLFTLLALSFLLRGSAPALFPLVVVQGEGISKKAVEVNNRGVEKFRKGEFLEALIQFITSSEMDKTLWKYHYNCAVVLFTVGNVEDARSHLDQSKWTDPDNPEMRRHHAELMRKIEGGEKGVKSALGSSLEEFLYPLIPSSNLASFLHLTRPLPTTLLTAEDPDTPNALAISSCFSPAKLWHT